MPLMLRRPSFVGLRRCGRRHPWRHRRARDLVHAPIVRPRHVGVGAAADSIVAFFLIVMAATLPRSPPPWADDWQDGVEPEVVGQTNWPVPSAPPLCARSDASSGWRRSAWGLPRASRLGGRALEDRTRRYAHRPALPAWWPPDGSRATPHDATRALRLHVRRRRLSSSCRPGPPDRQRACRLRGAVRLAGATPLAEALVNWRGHSSWASGAERWPSAISVPPIPVRA